MTVSLLAFALAVSIAPVRDSRDRLATYTPSVRKPSRQIPWQLVAAFLAISAAWILGGLPAGCAAVVLAGTLILRGRRANAAETRDLSQKMLLSGLEVLIAELSVGAHPAAASSVAGEECTGEVSAVFRSAGARARLGGSAAAAFAVPDSCIEREFSRIGSVWRVADQHGWHWRNYSAPSGRTCWGVDAFVSVPRPGWRALGRPLRCWPFSRCWGSVSGN